MPDQPKGKRRRGQPRPGRRPGPAPGASPTSAPRTSPVARRSSSRAVVPSGRGRVPWLAAGAAAIVVVVVGFLIFRPGGAPATGAGRGKGCPTSQPAALPAGQTRTVTLTTSKGTIVMRIEADLSPIAAGNFVALASCQYYDGTPFHRTATLGDGTPFVIQGGDPTGGGSGGPGYTIKDEPVTTPYRRGTVAMARSAAANSVGSQFFIVLDDRDAAVLSSANTYQIIGSVTSGMETADAILAASHGVEVPKDPVIVATATVANP